MRLGLILAVLLALLSPAQADILSDHALYLSSERGQRYDINVLIRDPAWVDATADPRFAEAVEEFTAANYGNAAGMLSPLAHKGHAKAQLLLGILRYQGLGGRKDIATGIRWIERAAEQDLRIAQFQLLGVYLNERRDDLAIRLLRKAAEQGSAYAQINLGIYYEIGVAGLPTDEMKAFEWFLKAAEAGEPFAMGQVAFRYYLGVGVTFDGADVEPDVVEAIRWGFAAADQNDPLGQYVLGVIYTEGFMDDRWINLEKGLAWYRRAAEQGYGRAQTRLVGFYHHGYGVPKDLVTAYMWAKLADRWVSEVASDMTPKQIAEGEKRAREWLEERRRKTTP